MPPLTLVLTGEHFRALATLRPLGSIYCNRLICQPEGGRLSFSCREWADALLCDCGAAAVAVIPPGWRLYRRVDYFRIADHVSPTYFN